MKCKQIFSMSLALVMLGLLAANSVQATTWTVTQLTDNSSDDTNPKIDGTSTVWRGWDGNDWEIYRHNGSVVQQITNDTGLTGDRFPDISGSNIAWMRQSSIAGEDVFLYSNGTTSQLTSTGYAAGAQVSGSNVAWFGYDGSLAQVFLYDGSITHQITDNTYLQGYLQLSGSNITWLETDNGEINDSVYLYNGSEVIQLTDNGSWTTTRPRISGNSVVWNEWIEYEDPSHHHQYEVFLYDGSTVQQLSNAGPASNPDISGSKVVWQQWDGLDYEIFLYDGLSIQQLTFNDFDDIAPRISGDIIVWRGNWGSYDSREIFLYDGSTTQRLTDNIYEDSLPSVSDLGVTRGRAGTAMTGKSSWQPRKARLTSTSTVTLTALTLPIGR